MFKITCTGIKTALTFNPLTGGAYSKAITYSFAIHTEDKIVYQLLDQPQDVTEKYIGTLDFAIGDSWKIKRNGE